MSPLTIAAGILVALVIIAITLLILGLIGREIFLYKVSGFTSFHKLWFWLKRDKS